jgi:hypothetical protein
LADFEAVAAAPPRGGRLSAWFDAPISGFSCVLGWCAATALFVLLVALLGGFAQNDAYESVFSTWAIAHGLASCAFPHGYNTTAPLYPLLSGAVAAATHIGHGVPFPQRAAMGPHCDRGFLVINAWSLQSNAIFRTLDLGLIGWLGLLGGVVAVLRASGRGRRRWEPATLALVACLPQVWTCLQSTFHPEDLLAVGLALGAVAAALRGSWLAAGLLIGLAMLSQQFAALVAVPLFFVAPRPRRAGYATGAALAVAAVALPLIVLTSGAATRAVFFGTGNSHGIGGALVSLAHLHGAPLVFVSRVVPLVLAALLATWALHRLGDQARMPIALLSLVAVSLGLRLVFEQQVFEYYFMALAVALVLLDVVGGRLRGSLVAWLVTVPIVDLRTIDGIGLHPDFLRLCVVAGAAAVLVWQSLRGASKLRMVPWMLLIACTFVAWPNVDPFGTPTMWFWQCVLVTWGLVLAGAPLAGALTRPVAAPNAPPSVRPGIPRFARPDPVPNH